MISFKQTKIYVAKRLGISFVNVLRLGYQNENELKEFQASLLAAKKRLSSMSEEDREVLRA